MTIKRSRAIWILLGLLMTTVPAWAQRGYYERDGAFRLHAGVFQLDGDSEYWDEKFLGFTGEVDDFENVSIGGDYIWSLNRHVGLQLSGNYFSGDSTQAYRGFVDNFGDRIRHDTTLEIASFTGGFLFSPFGPDAPVIPYAGVGGGIYSWRLEEDGDFIAANDDIFSATLEADGLAFGYYGLVGLEVPLSPRFSVFAEGRWTEAEDELEGDFEGFGDIDLSGREFLAGISWNL